MTWTVYSSLRESILNGALPPGESLSQVQLASQLGVSRGPLREAVRMLQREGLVEAEVNRRGRVSSFSIDDLEQLYAMRIVHESLAIRINVPRFTKRDIDALRGCLRRMEALAGHDLRQWQGVDREFHFTLLAHAGDRLMRTIRELYDHADRYRWLYIKGVPRALSIAADEHKAIFEASAGGDAALAAAHLARHLARTALTVLTHHAPEHDPTTVRAAIRLATGAETPAGERCRRSSRALLRDPLPLRRAAPRDASERQLRHQNQEPRLRVRVRRHAAEIGRGRIELRVRKLLAVQHVRRVQANLKVRSPHQRERARDAAVQQQRLIAAKAIDAQREEPLLKVCRHARRAALEARVGVEPFIERRILERDVVDVAVVENVAELQQRSRLPFERLARLPSAQDLAPEAAVVEERPAAAERQLPDAVERDAMRPRVLARDPAPSARRRIR